MTVSLAVGDVGMLKVPAANNQNSCVQPSKVQAAVIPVVATAASFWNKTLMFGLGGSGGTGLGKGFGFYGSGFRTDRG
jgi:hypothetical protein